MTATVEVGRRAGERSLLLMVVAFRLAGVIKVASDTDSMAVWLPSWQLPVLMGMLIAESTVVLCVHWRRGALTPSWLVTADALFLIAIIWVDVAVTADPIRHTWGSWILYYALCATVGFGLGIQRWWVAALVICAVTVSYGLCDSVMVGRGSVRTFEMVGFLVNGGLSWLLARTLRPQAAALDAARERAARQEIALAEERERTRQAALVHDRILQTLETLATRDWIPDRRMRQYVAAKACWLRAFVQGDEQRPASAESKLVDVISDVIGTHGLSVEFNIAQLRDLGDSMSPAVVDALAGAVHEALTNVARHSGVNHAVLHVAATDDEIVASVLDHGRGFGTGGPATGIGIRDSIRRRVAEAGGEALIESSSGGVYVEIRLPARAPVG